MLVGMLLLTVLLTVPQNGSLILAVNAVRQDNKLCWAGRDIIKFSYPVGSASHSVCLRFPCCGEFLVSRLKV